MRERVLITGGAGFVGTNVANRMLEDGHRVTVLDDLSRAGVDQNLRWLKERHGSRVRTEIADVADSAALRRALDGADRVFHLAAQVAVTTSYDDPAADAHTNLAGTLALLEEMRRMANPPALLFTSTNKVYGGLDDVQLLEGDTRYEPADTQMLARGVSEARPLAFCTPYGCSKGAADQYVVDYAHSYGLETVVFRMSCIYGPHQFGNEDQGWVAHFLIRALERDQITIYGDGKQVRDVLFVEDLVDAMVRASENSRRLAGRAFNIGGGPRNCVSLIELLDLIGELNGERPEVGFGDWRTGDQRYYVSDTRAFAEATGWRPRHDPRSGVERLNDWLQRHRVRPQRAAA
jgi:CDP-paratose 2-epimerase